MSSFKFRLQRVLDVRIWHEEESALRVAEARRHAEAARRVVESLRSKRSATSDHLADAHRSGGPVGQLQNLSLVIKQLDAQIAEASAARHDADRRVMDTLREHSLARRARRVLERLREKHLESDRVARRREECIVMDDIAAVRHSRKTPNLLPEG